MDAPATPQQVANSVLETLSGIALEEAAARAGIKAGELADAIEVYQAAGRAALEDQAEAARGWYSVSVQFTDWNSAERTATDSLVPQLQQTENTGALAGWWFIRKHPCWRLRCRPGSAATRTDVAHAMTTTLDTLRAGGAIDRWWETVYEPEALAFGGPKGMDIAHDLFHADSRGVLDYVCRHTLTTQDEHTLGCRELSILLCSTLLFGAGQEPHEQGDIWHRVEKLRPLPPGTPADRVSTMSVALQLLMNLDTSPTSALFNGDNPLAFIAPWAAAFEDAGRRLGDAARDGILVRGVRDILAHHVIFAWNRLGLDGQTQAILARAARETLMNPPDTVPGTTSSAGRS
ncbi:thiopeptide-type bacteriocin biosynthesis protein [Streptomyces sp.]|uniref:thiopeptide-type bacteriocin biosynthesis protein n=1 Tax=Streptomyces sp. TaxID=1931 RepID=UPI002F3E8ACD